MMESRSAIVVGAQEQVWFLFCDLEANRIVRGSSRQAEVPSNSRYNRSSHLRPC